MTLWFELLLRLFPSPFRSRFGAEIRDRALEDVERARRERGWGAEAWVLLATSTDLLRAAAAEGLNPTWIAGSDHDTKPEGWGMMMGEWIREMRQATRTLARSPGFLAATVGTLGLALGVNAGIFSVVDGVLMRPLSFEEPDRLVHIAASAPGSDFPEEFGVAAEFMVQYQEEADLLEDVARYNGGTATLRLGDRVERVPMAFPSYNLFALLGAEPALGRLPNANDDGDVVVLSHRAWVEWFGADPGALGQSPFASDGLKTVIGVMPPDFAFPLEDPLVYLPQPDFTVDELQIGRFGLGLVGRMTPDTDPDAVAMQLTALAARLPERFGGSPRYAALIDQHVAVVRPLEAEILGPVSNALWVLMGSVLVVLGIACANVANLFSVRAEGRGRELAVRKALGAGRRRLIRSLLAEALVISMLSAALALAFALVFLPAFLGVVPDNLPRAGEVYLSPAALAFTAAATVLVALACGLLPALGASRADVGRLRDGNRGSTQRRSWRRDGLVVVQTALALVLLVGSGLLLRSFAELRDVDPGYETADVFTFQFAPEQDHLVDGPSWARFHMDFLDRLEALPGVRSAGIVENVPLNESLRGMSYETEETAGDPDAVRSVRVTFAGGRYFETMGISLVRGRAFEERDLETGSNVVIAQTTADLLWPGEDPIGRRLRGTGDENWYTVVGVAEDVLQYSYRDDPEPIVYHSLQGPTPDAWRLSSPGYVVSTAQAETIAPQIRKLVRQVAPEAPMYRTFTMQGLADESMARLSFMMVTLALAAGLALLLGAIGLYGVLSYVVAQRSPEIGVRMALGAEAGQVRRMVVLEGARVVVLGAVLGLLAAAAASRALASLLFGIEPFDPMTFAVTTALLLVVGALASYVPARRASTVDPLDAMRGT
jgi:predicted permease